MHKQILAYREAYFVFSYFFPPRSIYGEVYPNRSYICLWFYFPVCLLHAPVSETVASDAISHCCPKFY